MVVNDAALETGVVVLGNVNALRYYLLANFNLRSGYWKTRRY
jgi:hypothetical protein